MNRNQMIKSRFESDGGVEHGPRLDQSLGDRRGWSGMEDHGDLFGDFRMDCQRVSLSSKLFTIYIYIILVGGFIFFKVFHSFPFSWEFHHPN